MTRLAPRIMVGMAETHVHGQLAHFAINADNVDRARNFYANVFGWAYEPYGPPGFFMVKFGPTAPAPILGAIQGRRQLVDGIQMTGFECTIATEDVDETVRRVKCCGGKIVMEKTTLMGVGHLIFFQDTEGNLAGAMQYDAEAK